MDLKDLIVTPIYFALIIFVAYLVRPYFTNDSTRKFFIPALTLRLIGAILLGLLYQFYYNGGDTYNFHTSGSEIIYEVFWDNPIDGIKLILSDGQPIKGLYHVTSQIPFYRDTSSFMIIRIAAIFDIFTFGTYSATALFFAVLSFSGLWALFNLFIFYFPHRINLLGLAVLIVPSVIFWGSGILKDTITLAALGWFVFSFHEAFLRKKNILVNVIIFLFASWLIYKIKIYLLIAILPALLLYFFVSRIFSIRNVLIRVLIGPAIILSGMLISYYTVISISNMDERYSLEMIAQTSRTTAYDIAFWTGRDAGSTYNLGELDGTISGMLRLAPSGIVVTLFRPFPWEVRNVLMAILSFESLLILLLTVYVIIRAGPIQFFKAASHPMIIFCMAFSLVFAFAVGVSTYNFGSLARYKIPLIPFYLSMLVMIFDQSKSARNNGEAYSTE